MTHQIANYPPLPRHESWADVRHISKRRGNTCPSPALAYHVESMAFDITPGPNGILTTITSSAADSSHTDPDEQGNFGIGRRVKRGGEKTDFLGLFLPALPSLFPQRA